MASLKLPKKPKGKLSLDREIAFTKKYVESANKIAAKKASINGLSTEREKLLKIRQTAKDNAGVGKKTSATIKAKKA